MVKSIETKAWLLYGKILQFLPNYLLQLNGEGTFLLIWEASLFNPEQSSTRGVGWAGAQHSKLRRVLSYRLSL